MKSFLKMRRKRIQGCMLLVIGSLHTVKTVCFLVMMFTLAERGRNIYGCLDSKGKSKEKWWFATQAPQVDADRFQPASRVMRTPKSPQHRTIIRNLFTAIMDENKEEKDGEMDNEMTDDDGERSLLPKCIKFVYGMSGA